MECPNGKITSLPKCEDNKEQEENLEVCMMEQQDEVVKNVAKGGLLVLRRDLPKT